MPKISSLPAVVTAAGSDIFPVVQGGVTKKETASQMLSQLQAISFVGSTGNNVINIPPNLANSLYITDGTFTYTSWLSQNQSPRINNNVRINQNAPFQNPYFIYTPGAIYNNTGVLQASQSGTTVTGVGTNFPTTCVDGYIYWPATGDLAKIVSRDSTTQLTVNISQTVASSKFEVWYLGLGIGSGGISNIQGIPINVGNIDTPPAASSASTVLNIGQTNSTSVTVYKTITLSQGVINAVTAVTSATYVDLTTDYTLSVNRSGAVAITLLAPTGSGRIKIIKDKSLAAATNNITITPASGTIDGAASLVINTNGGSYTLQDTSNGDWSIL